MPDTPPTRGELGQALRQLREAAEHSARDTIAAIGWGSAASLTRYEQGVIGVPEAMIGAMADLYDVPGDRREWLLAGARECQTRVAATKLLPAGDSADRQLAIARREEESVRITSLGATVMPGLLQSERYIRAIVVAGGRLTGDRLERFIDNRLARQRLLTKTGREFVQIVTPGALMWGLGGNEVMREQIDRLIDESRRPAVSLGVIPPAREVDVTMLHNLDVYERADGERSAIVGTMSGTALIDDAYDLDRYARLLDRLAALAEWGDGARAVLDEVRRSYE